MGKSVIHRILIVPVLGVVLATCEAVLAHHGTFTFDGDRIVTLEATVVEFRWTNPHGTLIVDVAATDGATVRYRVETDGPSILQPLGVGRDSLQAGDRIIVYASPSRSPDAPTVLGREAIREDGTVIGLSVAYTRRLELGDLPPADSVSRTWVTDKDALFSFVRSRDNWLLTDAGQASLAGYDIAAPFSQTACIPVTSPTLLMYPTAKSLAVREDHIEMRIDWMGASRTLFTDTREHPDPQTRFLQGHSVAWWEGDVLLVDTRNFSVNAMGNIFGVASGPDKHLQERFELAADRRSLTYSFTLSDPDYLAGPVTDSYTWHYRPDIMPNPVECSIDEASRHLSEQ